MIDYEYSALFLKDSVDKQLHIYYDNGTGHITNTDLYSEDFTLKESLCSESQLHFGGCEAGSVEFKIANSGVSLKGKTINVQMVLNNHTNAPFTFGTYKVQNDKPTADRFGRVITAYDAMYDIINANMLTWWNALPATFSIKTLRNSLFTYFGITQKATTLPNDNITITKPTLEKVSGKDIVHAICELNGCFGHIDRNNQMVYLTLGEIIEGLYPADDLYPSNTLYPREERVGAVLTRSTYTHAEYEDYTVQRISGIRIYNSKNELMATYKNTSNVYNITGNILADGLNNSQALTVIQNMYSAINNVWYMPCSVECVGNPCIEVGDSIQLSTRDKVVYMFVMERILKGIQALKDTYESHGEQYRIDEMNSLEKRIQTVSAKAETINANLSTTNTTVSRINTTVGEQGADISAIKRDYVKTTYLESDFIYTKSIKADQITSGRISATYLDASLITTGTINSQSIYCDQIYVRNGQKIDGGKLTQIDGGTITTGTISADRISSSIMRTNQLTANAIQGLFQSPYSGILTMGTVRAASIQHFNGGSGTYNEIRPETIEFYDYVSGGRKRMNVLTW